MKNNKLDVVYVLGTGSAWRNNELRFSLRSISKNLTNVGKVFIVGERPDYLKNIIHIPATDVFDPAVNADGNIIIKVMVAVSDPRLSDDFLFINDDHLVIKPMNISDVPPLHKGEMDKYSEDFWKLNYWRKRLQLTKDILISKNLSCFHYDCHTPILMNKTFFKSVMQNFDYKSGIGLTMKSLYGNSVYGNDGVLLVDQKKTVFKHYLLKEIEERLLPSAFLSFNDQGLNDSLKLWLISNFPNKSKYESNQPEDVVIDIHFWMNTGMPYQKGIAIFKKYFKHKNLIMMFESRESEYLRSKLNYKLNQLIKNL